MTNFSNFFFWFETPIFSSIVKTQPLHRKLDKKYTCFKGEWNLFSTVLSISMVWVFFCAFNRLLHTSHPFPCTECGEAFKRRKDLDLHSLTHQGKSLSFAVHPHICIFFSCKSNLKLMKALHSAVCDVFNPSA